MPHRLPSPFTIYAVTAAGVFGILAAARGLVDSDYYWHITAGRLIAENGVLSADPFSYTWAGQPWVMHEWLGEWLMYSLASTAGAGVAAFAFGVISAAGPLLLAATLRRQGIPMVPIIIVSTLVLYLFTSYATIRPQAISWFLLACLLSGLLSLRPEHRWQPWMVVPLFVVWANVHGLYVVGLGVLAAFAAMTVVGWTALAPKPRLAMGMLVAAVVASVLTPAGPAGLLYPLRYIDPADWGLRHISEWQSPDFHDPLHLGLLVLIVAVMANGMRATPRWLAVVAACGVAGALLATRNAPLTGLLAMPTLSYGLADSLLRTGRLRMRDHAAPIQVARRAMEIAMATVVVVAAAVVIPRLPAVAGDIVIQRTFPVEAVDRLEATTPDADVFAEYQWGGYVINRMYHLGGRVFVDGRNDMYDEEILNDFVTIRNAEHGWEPLLAKWGADAILLPPEAPLVRGPVQEAGWCELHRDAVAVLLTPCDRRSGVEGWRRAGQG